jgi:hypothetical protein
MVGLDLRREGSRSRRISATRSRTGSRPALHGAPQARAYAFGKAVALSASRPVVMSMPRPRSAYARRSAAIAVSARHQPRGPAWSPSTPR